MIVNAGAKVQAGMKNVLAWKIKENPLRLCHAFGDGNIFCNAQTSETFQEIRNIVGLASLLPFCFTP